MHEGSTPSKFADHHTPNRNKRSNYKLYGDPKVDVNSTALDVMAFCAVTQKSSVSYYFSVVYSKIQKVGRHNFCALWQFRWIPPTNMHAIGDMNSIYHTSNLQKRQICLNSRKVLHRSGLPLRPKHVAIHMIEIPEHTGKLVSSAPYHTGLKRKHFKKKQMNRVRAWNVASSA